MAEQTGIEWCDATFNPWWGCERVSPACAHCYADTFAVRLGMKLWPERGNKITSAEPHAFRFFGDKHWDEPLKWARTLPGKLGRRPRVFCASMADVFEERDELVEHRDRLFELIAATPELDWLLLTKRPEFARDCLFELDTQSGLNGRWITRDDDYFGWGCLANIWLGVSIENARYTWRADVLREIPAAVRFISAEPLLGSLYEPAASKPLHRPHTWEPILSNTASAGLEPHPRSQHCTTCHAYAPTVTLGRCPGPPGIDYSRRPLDLSGIDWVIIGGESGPKARPFHLEHAREIIEACDTEAGSPLPAVFVKQLGRRPREATGALMPYRWLDLKDGKGGDMNEWPADLRIREFPRAAVPA